MSRQRKPTNWNRWGASDELGTLNLVSDFKRRQAAELVVLGRTVSLARDMDTRISDGMVGAYQYSLLLADEAGESYSDVIVIEQHGFSITHIDAIGHVSADRLFYNGRRHEDVARRWGLKACGVDVLARQGIVTRGVFLDLSETITGQVVHNGWVRASDLEEAERRCGNPIEAGDALIVRGGPKAMVAEAEEGTEVTSLGYHADTFEWFRDKDISVLVSDFNERFPRAPGDFSLPVHRALLQGLGLPLVDNPTLAELSATCAELQRWTFMLMIAPLKILGGTGSPVNPLAVF